jgi:sarcosine oxidase subunit alpha
VFEVVFSQYCFKAYNFRSAGEARSDPFELGGSELNESSSNIDQKVLTLKEAGVKIMTRTTAFGLYDYGVAGLLERITDHQSLPSKYDPRQRFWTIRTKHIILATGAIERPIAFGNNDRPGVMSVSAARTYLNRFAILPGQKIIICTNNDSAYHPALELSKAG